MKTFSFHFVLLLSIVAGIGFNSCKKVDGVKQNYKYTEVTIGTQVWMGENLRVSKFRNGDDISKTENTDDLLLTVADGSYSNPYNADFNNNSTKTINKTVASYGRLYNWLAVQDERGLAPEGWHIPTYEEWKTLIDYYGGSSVAGTNMKDSTSAFNANYRGGYRDHNESSQPGNLGYWWCSTFDSTGEFRAWRMTTLNPFVTDQNETFDDDTFYSIRCVKD